jgi:hypothetical protein
MSKQNQKASSDLPLLHYTAFRKYLVDYLNSGVPASITGLNTNLTAMNENSTESLSTDLYDEINRRQKNSNLTPKTATIASFSERRKTARERISTLSEDMFKSFVRDVVNQLIRRHRYIIQIEPSLAVASPHPRTLPISPYRYLTPPPRASSCMNTGMSLPPESKALAITSPSPSRYPTPPPRESSCQDFQKVQEISILASAGFRDETCDTHEPQTMLTEQIIDLVLSESSNSVSTKVDSPDDEETHYSAVSAEADLILVLMKDILEATRNNDFGPRFFEYAGEIFMCHEMILNESEGQEKRIRPEVLREFLDIKHKMNDSIQCKCLRLLFVFTYL